MNRLLTLSVSCLILLTPAILADDKGKPKDAQTKPKDEKDSYDVIIKDMVTALKSATKLLTDVTDQKSADKAKPGLEKVGQDMAAVKERMDKLGQPTKEQEADLEKKFKPEMESTVKDMTTQIQRVIKEPYGKDLLALLQPKPKASATKPADKPKDAPKDAPKTK